MQISQLMIAALAFQPMSVAPSPERMAQAFDACLTAASVEDFQADLREKGWPQFFETNFAFAPARSTVSSDPSGQPFIETGAQAGEAGATVAIECQITATNDLNLAGMVADALGNDLDAASVSAVGSPGDFRALTNDETAKPAAEVLRAEAPAGVYVTVVPEAGTDEYSSIKVHVQRLPGG